MIQVGRAAEAETVDLIVDAANVVGSVPDGWWRDRAAAVSRLRDLLVPLAGQPLGVRAPDAAPPWVTATPVNVVLVVEGAARSVQSVPGVQVVAAAGSGDDTITELAGEAAARRRRCVVVTADRELRERVRDVGAVAVGPRTVYP